MIFGWRTIRIKKIDDYTIKCENCGKYHQRFSIFQQYFHLTFVPFFPTGSKTIKCKCVECNDSFNQARKKDYLALVKTPIYLYSGPLLVAGMILLGLLFNITNEKEKKEFVNNPKIGDVYGIRDEDHDTTAYYFIKLKDIKSDTLYFFHGALQYGGFVSSMSGNDYFVKDEMWRLLKSDMIHYLDSGYISSVERNYELTSRFNTEK